MKEIQKPAEWLLHIGPVRRYTMKWVGKAETQSGHKPHAWLRVIQSEKNAQFPVSP